MNKLNAMGAGPRIGGIALPWLVGAIFFSLKYKDSFNYFAERNNTLFFIGAAWVLIGLLLYILTAHSLIKGLRETRLITSGTYYLCCNPLYTAIILFLVPGISFMMNSWLILTTSIVAYIVFKIFINSEYEEMEKFFGEAYLKYRGETPEFIPLPIKKWRRAA